ncbi:hypothetical protein MRX96_016278 [Rhipicephalus microplus]
MEQVLQQFKENPNEAVRRLSQGTLMPPSQPGSPSPFDLQRWYDIRQGQATKPTFLTPVTPLSTTPTNAAAASPKMSPTFPPRAVLPSMSPPAAVEKEVVPEACPPVMTEPPMSSPENQLPIGFYTRRHSYTDQVVVTHDLTGGELEMPNLDDLEFSNMSLLDDDDDEEDYNSQYTGIESKSETDV